MGIIDRIDEYADNTDEELILLGFGDERLKYEPAILGIAESPGRVDCVAYDYDKLIAILAEDSSYEEAEEHFNYNIVGTYIGDNSPVFIRSI